MNSMQCIFNDKLPFKTSFQLFQNTVQKFPPRVNAETNKTNNAINHKLTKHEASMGVQRVVC